MHDNCRCLSSVIVMLVGRRELRKSRRRPSRYAASINLGDHCPPVRCVLWDISDGGARLTAARNVEDLPDRFSLLLNDTVERNCRVVWRNGRFLGVAFVNVVPPYSYRYREHTIETQCMQDWVAIIHPPNGGCGFFDPVTATIQEGEDVAIQLAKLIIDRTLDENPPRRESGLAGHRVRA
jgi:hypothetical protein